MLLFYIRHGYPIYDPDSLTPLGHRQAEAIARRLAINGIDQVFSSTSIRAMETAKPTCELLGKELQTLDFCHEGHAWEELAGPDEDGEETWIYAHKKVARLFAGNEIRQYGNQWYDHPAIKHFNMQKGIERIQRETDAFLASLGFEHDHHENIYRVTRPNQDRIALFAHQGFGLAFLSCVLDIPYPEITTHFDMSYTGMTVIDFWDEGGYAIPKALMVANDSHLYREDLPIRYHNIIPL